MARKSPHPSSRKSHTNYTQRLRSQHEVDTLQTWITAVIKKAPFKVEEEGWGEFDLGVTLHLAEREGTRDLKHDLNFQDSRYESPHKLVSALRDRFNHRRSRIVL